ncbi:MAG: tRNA epoxyqueuosine(34) reductase QueG [Pseudomonadota bacterium]
MTSPKDKIRTKALELGFSAARFTKAELPADVLVRLQEALHHERHGTMAWMESRVEERAQPKKLWEDTQTVLMLGFNYGPPSDPMAKLSLRDIGNISCYAQGDDYHDVVKKRLKQLGRWISETFDCPLKVFVDTAPVAEKPLAQKAGLGWQGKHTNLVSRDFGSWLFLGAIYLALDLDADDEESDHCGGCTACLKACPTNAFPAPYQLDARRCISYLTIEHKGAIPEEFRVAMGNRIYGCDDCLAVCPWNKFASESKEAKLHARDTLKTPPLADLAKLDDAAFRKLFSKSPIKRIGRNRFVRNVAIAIGNSGDPDLRASLVPLLCDEDEVVREAAAWADNQLSRARRGTRNLAAASTSTAAESPNINSPLSAENPVSNRQDAGATTSPKPNVV